jgi:L,D-peptidoglycan transpeptidase YkuD (ErfK/YbiS/YcfS/YnhG family)
MWRMRLDRRIRLGGSAIAAAAVLGLAAVPAHAAATGLAGRRYPGDVRELLTVTATSRSTTYATFYAYRLSHGHKLRVFGPWTARVGYNGIARPGKKREGDGRTPSGTYGFSFFFGVQPDRGFSFPFRHAYSSDLWDDDPASPRYNEWVNAGKHNPGARPESMHQVPAYDYAAVIAYNIRRVPGLGSAIFLHVGTGTATAGCVSLPRAELLKVLRWMRPRDHPVIRISAR